MRETKKIPTIAKSVPTSPATRETEAIAEYTDEMSLQRIVVICRAKVSPKPIPRNQAAQSTPVEECFLKFASLRSMAKPSLTHLRST
jgi:hypothetical protein